MSNNLVKLEQSLGYKFQNLALLERALTHRSWAYEQMPFGKDDEIRELHNESLEFLGDSILGLAVADYLFSNHPKATEGELTLMKHRLVNTETLAKLSEN
jgi:ribonuclease III